MRRFTHRASRTKVMAVLGVVAACLFVFASVGASATPTTVGYWRFENGKAGSAAGGTGTIVDSSGNGNDGTPSGGPTYTSDVPRRAVPFTGAPNRLSLNFNGVDQSVSFPDEWPFNTGDATLQFWMKYTDTQDNQELFWTRTDSTDADRFNIGITGPDGNATCPTCGDGDFFSDFRDPSGNLYDLVSGAYISPGAWHFVAFVKAGDVYTMYLDGTPRGTATQTGVLPNNVGWTISGRGSLFYDGDMDEVQLSDVALAPSQFESVVAVPPNHTRITRTSVDATKHTASFRFTASGIVSGYQCALVKPGQRTRPRFSSCRSPHTYTHIAARTGRYTFEVRATNAAGHDPRTAVTRFRI